VTAELKKQKYVYYHCATRCRREAYVPETRMSALFADAVRRLKLPDDIREAFVASLRDSRREVEVDVRARITAAQARLERVSRLINAAYEDKLEGRIDDAFLNAKRAEWESQRAGATEEIQRLARATAKNLDTAIQVFELVNRVYDLFISRDARDQRVLLEVLLSNSVLAEGRITVTYRKHSDILSEIADPENEEGGDSASQNRRPSVGSAWQNEYRTFWLDPQGWTSERVLAFEPASAPCGP
ncbi:MAG: hypothetical protein RLZZ383_2939, partial [Pseudomonadota bacterium]